MKKEDRNRNWIAWIALGLSVIAIVISIIAICISCPHIPELGFDYQGIIIGVLSLLVTILLGWQIYSAIYIKDSLKKEVLKSSAEMVLLAKNTLLKSQLNTLYGLHEGALRNGDINYIMSTLDIMMDIAIQLKDKEIADRIISKIPNLWSLLTKMDLMKTEKNKYNELKQRIKEFSTKTENAFDIYEKTNYID